MAESRYVALVGFDHDPSGTRVEEGEAVPAGLPEKVYKDLLAQKAIKRGKPAKGKAGS